MAENIDKDDVKPQTINWDSIGSSTSSLTLS